MTSNYFMRTLFERRAMAVWLCEMANGIVIAFSGPDDRAQVRRVADMAAASYGTRVIVLRLAKDEDFRAIQMCGMPVGVV